jgi:hypothetical protein
VHKATRKPFVKMNCGDYEGWAGSVALAAAS